VTSLIELEPTEFGRRFGSDPLAIHHLLADHPLLTFEAILELADRLHEKQVQHNLGTLPVVLTPGETPPKAELSPGEVIRGIATNGCWVALWNIESDPPYARLLNECLDDVVDLIGARERGMGRRECFLFLSAPGSVTPVHIDPEHNFLLQVRGRKEIHVASFTNAEVEQREIERFYAGGYKMTWLPDNPATFSMGPGDGVYVPMHAPHWVTVPDCVSVSLSITFRTPASADYAVLHRLNASLRRMRLSPAPVGRHPRSDRVKIAAGRALKSSAQRVRGK